MLFVINIIPQSVYYCTLHGECSLNWHQAIPHFLCVTLKTWDGLETSLVGEYIMLSFFITHLCHWHRKHGAQGAGTPMKFLSGTQTMSYFTLKCLISVNMIVHVYAPEHPFTKSSSYASVCIHIDDEWMNECMHIGCIKFNSDLNIH